MRKQQEVVEEIELMIESKKSANNQIGNLERNINALQEDNIKLRRLLELSEREKNLLEKNMAKLNGK